MYSSSVIMVLTVGKGVYGFTLDPLYGEFVLTHNNIKVPSSGSIYSFNEGNYQLWDDKLRKYIDDLKVPGPSGKPSVASLATFTAHYFTVAFTDIQLTRRARMASSVSSMSVPP